MNKNWKKKEEGPKKEGENQLGWVLGHRVTKKKRVYLQSSVSTK